MTDANDLGRVDRRTFLARSALGSGALVAGAAGLSSGCGAALPRPTLPRPESEALLARLDRGLARARDRSEGAAARRLRTDAPPGLEAVVRLTMEALVVADVTRSVPDRAAVPPLFAARIAHEAPVIERCVDTHHAMLTRIPRDARRRLNRQVRERPDVSTDIAEWIDDEANQLGVARESRARLRRSAAEMKIRMRRQSATAVIDDVAEKVGRIIARRDAPASAARRATSAAMAQAIWQHFDGQPTGGAGGGLGQPELTRRPIVIERERERRWNRNWGSPGDEEIELGVILMPLGLITCTVLLWVGLGYLVAGVVQNEQWDGRPQPQSAGH